MQAAPEGRLGNPRLQRFLSMIGQENLQGLGLPGLIDIAVDIALTGPADNPILPQMVQGQFDLVQRQVCRPGNDVSLGKGDLAQAQEAGDDVVRQTGIAGFQAGHDVVFEAAVFLRMGVEDFPAGYGMHGRKGPQDETVPSLDIDFILLQAQLQKALRPRRNLFGSQGYDAGHDFPRPDEEAHALP